MSSLKSKAGGRFVPVAALLLLLGARKNAHADGDLSATSEEPRTAAGERTWLPQIGIIGIIGIKGSAGLTHFLASPDDQAAALDTPLALGGSIGLFAVVRRYAFRNLSVGIQAELLYSARPGSVRDGSMSGRELRFALNYVELPILGHIDVTMNSPWSPFALLGISPGLLESAHMKPGAEDGVYARDLVHDYDLGWIAALGTRYALSGRWQVTLEARYQRGAVSIFRYTDRHSSALSISIGIGYDRSSRTSREGKMRVAEEPEPTPAGTYRREDAESEVTALDRRYALLVSTKCYQEDRTLLARTRNQPEEMEIIRLAYTRRKQGNSVTLRDVRPVRVQNISAEVAACVLQRVGELSWREPDGPPEGETRHELGFPLHLVREAAGHEASEPKP